MTKRKNEFDQATGESLQGWNGAELPQRRAMEGRFCRVEPLEVERHLDELFEAYTAEGSAKLWTYMPIGPFDCIEDFREFIERICKTDDPLFYAFIELTTGKAVGMAAYMRIKPEVGVMEVGSITYSIRLQRTPVATEAMYLMMRRAFNELGYRRYEWKCDSLNVASRQAAERLGFSYDGLFKQAIVYKGRNRDTTWYSMLDGDWPVIEKAYKKWLDAENFDEDGQQKRRLQELMFSERK